MKRHLLCLLVATIAGCAPARQVTPPIDNTPLYVEVGDAWDDALRKLKTASARPAASWWTLDELEDEGRGLPRYPSRRVWVLRSGESIKLWGDDSYHMRRSGVPLPQRVTRIDRLSDRVQPNVEPGELRLVKNEDVDTVQRVSVGAPADAR